MKKKKILTLILAGGIFIAAKGQIQRQTGEITVAIYSGASVEAFETPETTNPNDNYLYEDWAFGSIDLEQTERVDIPQIPIRYNVVLNELEVKTDDMIKVVDLSLVREFNLLRPENIDPVKFKKRLLFGDRSGIFEVIAEGKHYSAYVAYDHDVLAPDYNPQFDVGSKVPKTIIKEHYYLFSEKDSTMHEFKFRTKSFVKLFREINPAIYDQIKKTKSKFESKEELAKLMDRINSIQE